MLLELRDVTLLYGRIQALHETGLYVICEGDFETHGFHADSTWGEDGTGAAEELMRWVLDELLADAGVRLDEQLSLSPAGAGSGSARK